MALSGVTFIPYFMKNGKLVKEFTWKGDIDKTGTQEHAVTRHGDFISIYFYVRNEGRPVVLYLIVVFTAEIDVLHLYIGLCCSPYQGFYDTQLAALNIASSRDIISPDLSEILP